MAAIENAGSEGGFIPHAFTQHLSSVEDIHEAYESQGEQHPHHVSFVTGQPEPFMIYEVFARAIYQAAQKSPISSEALRHVCFLRYPNQVYPQSLTELFERYPMREDYDTASSVVQDCLIAVSPSLKENDRDESAFAIFRDNDRDDDIAEHVSRLFMDQHVPRHLFESRLESLLDEMPSSGKGGIVTQIFLPKGSDLHQVVYRSLPYGIPYGSVTEVSAFFENYAKGVTWEDDPDPQLRCLASALFRENIHMVRYTLLTQEQLDCYTQKVDRMVRDVFAKSEMSLKELAEKKEKAKTPEETEELARHFLLHSDPTQAWECLERFPPANMDLIAQVIQSFLEKKMCEKALEFLGRFGGQLPQRSQILLSIGLILLDQGQKNAVEEVLKKLPESPQRNLLALLFCSHFPEMDAFCEPFISKSFSRDMEELSKQVAL